jgi:hypothetical protein
VEDISAFAKHKNPQVKEQTYKFLVRSLSTTRVAPSLKTDLKPLSDALLSGMDDSFGPVRDAAAEGLGTLNKIVGDRAMTAILDNLDDIKKKKVQEFAAKAEVRCKGLSAAAASVKPTAAPANRPATFRPVSKRSWMNAHVVLTALGRICKLEAAPYSPIACRKRQRKRWSSY